MKLKYDAQLCLKNLRASSELATSVQVKALRIDTGADYINKEFATHPEELAIWHDVDPPHSPQIYGTAERTNRTVENQILMGAVMPKVLWVDTLKFFCHTLNYTLCHLSAGFKAPNTVLSLSTSVPSRLHRLGCQAWYKTPEAT